MHRYRVLLALPGARAPMLLSIAGRILGVFSLANAFGSVAQGRLMDRLAVPAFTLERGSASASGVLRGAIVVGVRRRTLRAPTVTAAATAKRS